MLRALVLTAVFAAFDASALVPLRPCDLVAKAVDAMDAQAAVAAHAIDGNLRVEPSAAWVRAQGRWWQADPQGFVAMPSSTIQGLPLATLRAQLGRSELNCMALAENNDLGPRARVYAIGTAGDTMLPRVLHVEQATGLPLRYTEAVNGRIVRGEQYRYAEAVDDPGVDFVSSGCSGGFTGGGGVTTVYRDGRVIERKWTVAGGAGARDEQRGRDPARATRIFDVVDAQRWPAGRFGSPGNMTCEVTVRIGGRVSSHVVKGASVSPVVALVPLQRAFEEAVKGTRP